MMRPQNRLTAILVSLLIACLAPAAVAAELNIKAFFGKFEGGGIAENEDSIYFGVTARDFDVVIEPQGDGFAIIWTSVIRGGGTPGNAKVRRKTTALAFAPSTRPGIWRAATSKDPIAGGEQGWATIRDTTLSVYLMAIDDDGAYEIQQYDRKILPTGMELVFTRQRDGEQVRTVKGRLVKVAK